MEWVPAAQRDIGGPGLVGPGRAGPGRPPSLLSRRSERLLMMPAIVVASRFAFFLLLVGCFITGGKHKRKGTSGEVGWRPGGWGGADVDQARDK